MFFFKTLLFVYPRKTQWDLWHVHAFVGFIKNIRVISDVYEPSSTEYLIYTDSFSSAGLETYRLLSFWASTCTEEISGTAVRSAWQIRNTKVASLLLSLSEEEGKKAISYYSWVTLLLKTYNYYEFRFPLGAITSN